MPGRFTQSLFGSEVCMPCSTLCQPHTGLSVPPWLISVCTDSVGTSHIRLLLFKCVVSSCCRADTWLLALLEAVFYLTTAEALTMRRRHHVQQESQTQTLQITPVREWTMSGIITVWRAWSRKSECLQYYTGQAKHLCETSWLMGHGWVAQRLWTPRAENANQLQMS